MQLAERICALCAAALLGLSAVGAKAQDSLNPGAAAPTVPSMVEEAYRWGDFAELERLYTMYGKAGVRSQRTGTPRVRHFWMGIGAIHDSNLRVTSHYHQQMDALTGKWARENPQSVLAQLLHASSLAAHAQVHRGNGYADTVSPAGWAGHRKYLELAAEQLQRTSALAAHDSSWNEIMLGVGLRLGWDRQRLMAIFESGIAKNPDHDELYFSMQESLLPKWGGDLEMVGRFIERAVKNTREKRGMEMYARLYAGVSYAQVHQTLFTTTRVSWADMKTGFEDLLRRYPDTSHRNMYAYFACMANDRPALQQQLELMGDAFEPIFWGSRPERSFEACKDMARQV